jgi:hypothetical protein
MKTRKTIGRERRAMRRHHRYSNGSEEESWWRVLLRVLAPVLWFLARVLDWLLRHR